MKKIRIYRETYDLAKQRMKVTPNDATSIGTAVEKTDMLVDDFITKMLEEHIKKRS